VYSIPQTDRLHRSSLQINLSKKWCSIEQMKINLMFTKQF